MLKHVMNVDRSGAAVKISEASFPAPFASGLEYGAPARGTWNIVHTGMLIPEAHQIFVCASNCLRGVVLTAAEMKAEDRFSTITIKENDFLEGDMEDMIIEGVSEILERLSCRPRAVLVYSSCVHHFTGCDLELCYDTLRQRFPETGFTDCYMNPIMRKSGLTPDQIMRRQLYSLWKKDEGRCHDESCFNIVGNNFGTDRDSELFRIAEAGGKTIKEITDCSSYEEYLKMAEASVNITNNPAALACGDFLEKEFGIRHLYLPLCYGRDEIRETMKKLAEISGCPADRLAAVLEESEKAADEAADRALKIIGETPISLDYTLTPRPLSLGRLLLERGFKLFRIYADSFTAEEKEDFLWLKEHYPELEIYSTVHVKMRVLPRRSEGKTLALGQKAAYFTGTGYFVNLVEGGGLYGFAGIKKLMELMTEAFLEEKDTESLIQRKGWGCESCV